MLSGLHHRDGAKPQAPNPQTPTKHQTSTFKAEQVGCRSQSSLKFGALGLEFLWGLEFGVWSFYSAF